MSVLSLNPQFVFEAVKAKGPVINFACEIC